LSFKGNNFKNDKPRNNNPFISIPRMELMGALLAVRLARKIRDSFTFNFKGTRYFTDSSVVLGMLKCDSASFLEFVGTRVSEIKSLSVPDKEWFWIPTDCNLADLGTRPNVEPGDLAEDSDYQNGMFWMRLPEEEWPVRKEFSAPPEEERRKDVVTVASALSSAAPGMKFRSLKKLVNTYAFVFQAVKKGRFRIGYDIDGVPVLPSKCHLSDLYLLQAHEVDHGGTNNMVMRSRTRVWIM
jgi:Pao retrotransposon peptidase